MKNPSPPREDTILESADEVRAALVARASADPYEPQAFRPTHRPPSAMLRVVDDPGKRGIRHHLMQDKTVFGRSEGDILVPHDGMMSARHAELVRQRCQTGWRWILNDLGSTNGTYVRIRSGILRHGQEFLIGRSRFRFEAGRGDKTVPESGSNSGSTLFWKEAGAQSLIPSVVELAAQGEGRRIPIGTSEIWLGRDPACEVSLAEDPFANGRHARIHRDTQGRWFIENAKSRNGVWIRVEQIPLEGDCQFLLGEQRFKLRTG